ncbi:helix-turn-helix transcriptional regulator [Azospirillum thermophilum]|uniref:Transcriptional regulator n=1 Tax=Azospirillum thermophilum TaxID=2202148 RepID=A0A2S2CZR2_9PROT|nr:YafY family protein [Azospirillum thermophilum]AWK89992.1 transcriptional regulator [Azospirillum thermophilum]
MSRAQRLLDLLQILRRHRRPVTGKAIAEELGVSLRTLYRDIATLQAQGARIEGEPGVGYLLRPGFLLPPLMFSEEEIEALVLGSRWVADRTDDLLGAAARDALAKIAAVLPEELREDLDATTLLIGPGPPAVEAAIDLAAIRQAIREERKLEIAYRDVEDAETRRTVWPFALGFFDRVRILVAWCELRDGFRHFRADRILSITATDRRYPRRRQALLKDWREDMRRQKEAGRAANTPG